MKDEKERKTKKEKDVWGSWQDKGARRERLLTLFPGREKLRRVDDLRVKPRCHLNADDTREQQEVHPPQIRFFPPGDRILHRHAMDPIVVILSTAAHGCWSIVLEAVDATGGGVVNQTRPQPWSEM
jgi:hypothetical protein